MKTDKSRTNYAHIFVSARSVRHMRNSSVDWTWTVIDCKWICVKGCLCVILSFEWLKKNPTHNCASVCIIHVSACIVYASSMRDYVRDTRRSSVLMRRNWLESVHVHVRPLTPQFYITQEQRTYHVHSTDIHWLSLTKLTNASMCTICQWFVSDCNWYVRGSCVHHACFISDFCSPKTQKFGQFLDAQAHTNPICAWFVSDLCVIGCVTGP